METKIISQQKITSIKNLDNKYQTDRVSRLRNTSNYVNYSSHSERACANISLSDKTFEKPKKCRKNLSKSEEDMKEIEEVWQLRENDSKRQDSNKIQKSSEIDTLMAIAVILILFCLALYLAPNQFYTPPK